MNIGERQGNKHVTLLVFDRSLAIFYLTFQVRHDLSISECEYKDIITFLLFLYSKGMHMLVYKGQVWA